MAPKKSKGKSKGKLVEAARPEGGRFVKNEARDRWEMLKAIPFIYERGFAIEKRVWSKIFDDQIVPLGWQCLCHPRTEAVLPWVQEFYANAMFSEGDDVLVRGRMVNFSYTAINAMFELDDAAINPYDALQASATRDEMAAALCGDMTPECVQKNKGALKSTCLSREAKVWMLFINASLAPTRHLNLITFDRIAMIYDIFQGIKFNIGTLLNKAIKQKAREEKPKCLWFPTLITELCKNARVEVLPEDVIAPVRRHITERVVQVNIKVAKELPKRKKTAPATPAPDQYTRPPPESAEYITLEEGPPAETMKALEYLKTYQRLQHVYFDQRLDYICGVQAQLMHKAKLPMPEPSYRYSGNFDKRGYLMTTGRNRLDPAYDDNDSDDIPEEDRLAEYLDEDDDDEDDEDNDDDDDEED